MEESTDALITLNLTEGVIYLGRSSYPEVVQGGECASISSTVESNRTCFRNCVSIPGLHTRAGMTGVGV